MQILAVEEQRIKDRYEKTDEPQENELKITTESENQK